MSINMPLLMEYVAALEEEALLAMADPPADVDAVDRFFHTQSSYPYFVNRLGAIEIDSDSEDYDVYTVNVLMRLLVGHITEGYDGEPENRLQAYIPQVITYFNERELLQSVTYGTALIDLERARVVACTGFTIFQQSGSGSQLVGAEFTLRCEFREEIEQQYL